MSESSTHEDCTTCKKQVACSEGRAYSTTNTYRFKDFKEISFEFCPYSLVEDQSLSIYYSQIWALQYGVNTLQSVTPDDLEALLLLTTTRDKIKEKRYMEFWAKALGGKK